MKISIICPQVTYRNVNHKRDFSCTNVIVNLFMDSISKFNLLSTVCAKKEIIFSHANHQHFWKFTSKDLFNFLITFVCTR